MEAVLRDNSMENPQKVEDRVTYDLAIALLSIYPKDRYKCSDPRGTCTPIFTAAMSTIAKLCKEPRCPSTDEWIKKM